LVDSVNTSSDETQKVEAKLMKRFNYLEEKFDSEINFLKDELLNGVKKPLTLRCDTFEHSFKLEK